MFCDYQLKTEQNSSESFLSLPCSGVGMQPVTLCVTHRWNDAGCIPTRSVATMYYLHCPALSWQPVLLILKLEVEIKLLAGYGKRFLYLFKLISKQIALISWLPT